MPSDAEALRAYIGALTGFLSLLKEASQAGKSVWVDPDLSARREALITQIKNSRADTLVAGCNSGAWIESLGNSLTRCEEQTSAHKGHEANGSDWAYQVVEGALETPLRELRDCLSVAEAKPASKQGGSKSGPKTGPNDERDKWIYDQMNKDGKQERQLEEIRAELNKIAKSRKWEEISSVQGLRQAAMRYAKRNSLSLPRKRRSG